MKKIIKPTITLIFSNKLEDKKHLKTAYERIFRIAQQNIVKRRKNTSNIRTLKNTID